MPPKNSPGQDDEYDSVLVARQEHSLDQQELLKTPLPRVVEQDYRMLFADIRRQYRGDVILVYASKEFKDLRLKLTGLVGETFANEVMNNNI